MIKVFRNSKLVQRCANLKEAAYIFSVSVKDIQRQMSGKIKNVKGYTFRPDAPRETERKPRRRTRPDLRRPIRCEQTGRTFASVQAAAAYYDVHPIAIHEILTGKRRYINASTAHTFEYYEPVKRPRRKRENDLFMRIDE